MDFRNRFLDLWHQVATTSPEEEWNALRTAYDEKHRAYHNLHHVEDCFQQLDSAEESPQHALALELAMWFHDIVYKPRSRSNEEDSALWARRSLQKGQADPQLIHRVETLILATRHQEIPTTPDAQLLIDIDLSILGRDPEAFQAYENQIRREYRWVPAPLYRRNRARILQSFLERPFLYSTPSFRQRYEEQARDNLETSLRALS